MTAAQSSGRRAAGFARFARPALPVLFGLSMVAATWAYHHRPGDYPPWLDYDSAALGIFVNNISYREHYDEFFRDSPRPQAVFRGSWAASFLPATAPMSAVQRWLGIPPDRVDVVLKGAGLFFGVLGTLCAAWLARGGARSPYDALFLFGLVASLPPFLLYLRTAVPNFVYSYFMFWLATLCMDRYVSGRGRRWIYALALTLALYAMVPYVPIAVLPIVGLLLARWRGTLGRSLRDPHLYVAAAASVALFASLRLLVGSTFEPSYEMWSAKTVPYLSDRAGHAISPGYLHPALLPGKLAKLTHQHFIFARDKLGDQSRSDAIWTVPAPQLAWIALLPLALLGMWRSRRDGDESAAPFAAVLIATYGLALTVSFPEGRYILPAIPALAFFVLQGMRALVPDHGRRVLACAAVLFAMAWNSHALVSGPYEDWFVKRWQDRAGMREALALIRERSDPEYGRGRDLRFFWPEANHEVWLYMQMLANLRVQSFRPDGDLAAEARGETLFAAVPSDDPAKLGELRSRGFQGLGTVTDPFIGRSLEVLALEP